jgi:lipopolysaccharide transport system permease protein
MTLKSSMTNTVNERFNHKHLTTIRPRSGWHMLDFKEIWSCRELLGVFTMRDIKVRYKQTVLGAAWAVIQPLTTMIIFTVIFGRLAKIPSEGFPYPVFVYAGLLPWNFFANALSSSGNSLVGASHLISKVYFPRLIIPLSSVGAGIVDLLISTAILLLLMLIYGVPFTLQLVFAPLLMLGVIITALGVGTLLSALTVSYRDFRFVVPFMIQIWMYLTPVVYGVGFIPEKYRCLLMLNPMAGYIDGCRAVFLGKPFNLTSLTVSVVLSLLLLCIGAAYFEKVERRFADII